MAPTTDCPAGQVRPAAWAVTSEHWPGQESYRSALSGWGGPLPSEPGLSWIQP